MEEKLKVISSCNDSYKAAVRTLFKLQSNNKYLKLATKSTSRVSDLSKFLDTKKCLLRSGITFEQLDTLSVIHVTGTKGKGSTCAYVESILREHGFRTGFFSSPHLVTVRERIRINGQPISKDHFTRYFWKIYKKLEDTKQHETDMPAYFKFLTILMFDIFLDANVDVAIIEVGIGGLYDSTNIVRNPVCVGIANLALDHTALLGDTIEDIAYQKAGIFKPETAAFSVPQTPRAMRVLEKSAIESNCTLRVVPAFRDYKWENITPISQVANVVQQQNASLAIQLATEWMLFRSTKRSIAERIADKKSCDESDANARSAILMDKIATGLSRCKWPGRMQILKSTVGDFFLDGAHTIESIECGISWFKDVSRKSGGRRILIFNTSGTRNPTELLTPLKSLQFHEAYFVPNFAGINNLDDEVNSVSIDEQKINCEANSKTWGMNSVVKDSVMEALQDIRKTSQLRKGNCENGERNQILITGSLHLVGAALAILDPNFTMTTQF